MGLSILPLHVWDRELDARILLSVLLALEGETVVIGHEYNVSPLYCSFSDVYHYGPGRPVYHSLRTEKWYAQIMKRGGFVGLTYEEGVNNILHEATAKKSYEGINEPSVSALSEYYAWCSLDRDQLISATPPALKEIMKKKCIIASNPRIDLLGDLGASYFRKRACNIFGLFGDFFLISDNFGFDPFGSTKPSSHLPKSYYESRSRFSQLISRLAYDNPSTTFVLRPHPVASPSYWHTNLSEARNIIVLYRDSIEPWLYACRGVLHSGCTVGYQAELSNVASINLSNICEDFRPASVSSYCSSYQPNSYTDLLECIKEIKQSSPHFNEATSNKLKGSITDRLKATLASQNNRTHAKAVDLGVKIPRFSALNLVMDQFRTFRSQCSPGIAINDDHVEIANKAKSILGNDPPLPGKSRYYSLLDIAERCKQACQTLGINRRLSVMKLSSYNVFMIKAL